MLPVNSYHPARKSQESNWSCHDLVLLNLVERPPDWPQTAHALYFISKGLSKEVEEKVNHTGI